MKVTKEEFKRDAKRAMNLVSVAVPSLVLTEMCAELWLRYPDNHGGGFYGYVEFILSLLVLAAINAFAWKGWKAGIFASIMCLALVYLADWFNLNVDYLEWISRGMPDFGEFRAR